jgi:3-oxoacyl-[acyl-carrier-protein] synthase-1
LQPLAISHFSIVNSLGAGARAVHAALSEGRSGLAPCAFETATIDTWVGAVKELDGYRVKDELADYDCRNNRLAQMALGQDGFADAVAAARAKYGAQRIGVFMGTSTSGILETELAYRRREEGTGALPSGYRYAQTQNMFSLAEFVRRYLALAGPALVVSSACSSSTKVFGSAARMIEAGVCDAAVVGGVDTLCLTTLYGFRSLELTSREPCRPFDAARSGISLGEGAGFALLERAGSGTFTGGVGLFGVGESSDAYHMSAPHPEGTGITLAMQRALQSASVQPGDIDYINLHGTATRANDAAEDKAVHALFGPDKPCSSTKGATGHLLGAAGATEALICAIAMSHDLIPAGAHTRTLDPALRSGYVLENRQRKLMRTLTNSFGFGGSNCCLVLGRLE